MDGKNDTDDDGYLAYFEYSLICLVWFDSFRPSQQFFSHVIMGLPGLNQY